MTLGHRLLMFTAVSLLGLILVAAVAVWGLLGLRGGIERATMGLASLSEDLEATAAQIRKLRDAFEVSGHIESAGNLLRVADPRSPDIDRHLTSAATALGHFIQRHGPAGELDEMMPVLVQVIEERQRDHGAHRARLARAHQGLLERVARALRGVGEHTRQVIAEAEQASIQRRAESEALRAQAARRARVAMGTIAAVALLAIIGGAVVGTMQYRRIMHPLRRLQGQVRQVASGRFDRRLEPAGDAELAELTVEFNRMSQQLHELYTDLESQVRSKSAELARSERLASVGFLAAGVAHEINNPLGIISGYAELSLRPLEKGDSPDREDLEQSLRIIRDEAFRCKAIIERLLLLARGGDEPPQSVALQPLAEEVVAMARGLKAARDRQLRVETEPAPGGAEAGPYHAMAHRDQLKQVLLNLVVNALEATEPGRGRVVLRIGRAGDGRGSSSRRSSGGDNGIALSVEDNGRGMEPQVLERVFEPFFTSRGGGQRRGVGLGLSISHAIIEHMGGRLRARSDGPGRGSVFTIELPEAGANR